MGGWRAKLAEIRPDRVPCGCACLLALLLSAAAYLGEGWEQDKRGAEARHANQNGVL